jgi:hypothetical protein
LFFFVVSLYEFYADNNLLLFLAVAVISISGLIAWVWSIQPKKED